MHMLMFILSPVKKLLNISQLRNLWAVICIRYNQSISLQWRHNGRNGVSNHQPHHCLLNRLFGSRSKKTSKLRVTGLCAENSPGTGEFPAQMASNTENVSIWWRHHVDKRYSRCGMDNSVVCVFQFVICYSFILDGLVMLYCYTC